MKDELSKLSSIDPQVLQGKVLARIGRSPTYKTKFLGKGSWGSAYDVGKGQVLKLTQDESEARALAVVQSNPTPYIVNVFDVFQLSPKLVTKPLFGILQEKLMKPSTPWALFANEIQINVLNGKRPISKRLVLEFINELEDEREWDDDYLPMFTEQRIDWLLGVADYLDRVKIKFYDFHEGNIMRRKNGQHALIDLGESKSPRAKVDLVAHANAEKAIDRYLQEITK